MSSQYYENDAQNLSDKVGNKVNEFAGEAQQQFGDAVDSPKHQLKGAARKYAAQASSSSSSAAICWLTADCFIPHWRAAAEKDPASTTRRKVAMALSLLFI